ncbi:MAG: hypothetical protein PHR47_02350 [Candidatus Pacebacteria bacterium]|nr:hypothetical protein [Candidatus Paceibacterota bacterium]
MKKEEIILALINYESKEFQEIITHIESIEFSFDHYLELFSKAHSKKVRSFALEKMLQYGEFALIVRIFEKKVEPYEERIIIKALSRLAITFEEYFFVYPKCNDKKTCDRIIETLNVLAKTFEEWKRVYNYFPQEKAFQKLVETATSLDQLFEVLNRNNDQKLEGIILEKMRKFEPSIKWLNIYNQAPDGGEIKTMALNKVRELIPLRCSHVQV